MINSTNILKYALIISLFAVGAGFILNGASVTASNEQPGQLIGAPVDGVLPQEPITATFTVTKEQFRRNYSYALGKLLGQKARGSGDPANEFSIITTANVDGTFTAVIPAGRATTAQVQAVLDDPTPEQPVVVKTREDELLELLAADTINLRQIAELMRLERGF